MTRLRMPAGPLACSHLAAPRAAVRRPTWRGGVVTLALTVALSGGCDKKSGTRTSGSPTGPSFPGAAISEAVLVGAGDINLCGQPGAEATAALLDSIPGTVFAAGDIAYMRGSTADFQCYDRTWGRHKSRTYAAPDHRVWGTTRSTSAPGTSSR